MILTIIIIIMLLIMMILMTIILMNGHLQLGIDGRRCLGQSSMHRCRGIDRE